MFGNLISLIKLVITSFKESHELLGSIYYLMAIIEHCKLGEVVRNIWLSIEWSKLLEQSHIILMLAQRYFN